MLVKNVLKGLEKEFDIEELNIITDTKVVFSGSYDQWKATAEEMISYKKEIENSKVINRMMFNNRKAFIFI